MHDTGGKRRLMRRLLIGFAVLLLTGSLAAVAWSGSTRDIIQKGRAFAVSGIEIMRGDTLRFTNDDEFLHQIYVAAPNMSFESNEQAPGQTISVAFPTAGTFEVHCHIHPKMLLTVKVD